MATKPVRAAIRSSTQHEQVKYCTYKGESKVNVLMLCII